jgi:hypothetical protein
LSVMADPDDEPTEPTPENKEKVAPPAADGPHEVQDAAEQEAEYPEDETDEG